MDSTPGGTLFLQGPAGAGKTTVGRFKMIGMIEAGVDPASILILVPQRRLGEPYRQPIELNAAVVEQPEVITVAGLARRMIELFWPVVAEQAGFGQPGEPPRFLTLETAQYHLSRVVGPYLDEGYFESLSLDRYRLYRQILDNLNKAAVVGFPASEINERLSEAWVGPEEQTRIYDQAQRAALQFRAACFADNLVDFSLQYELFFKHVEVIPGFREHFSDRYHHLIVDNVEEETPQGHDFIERWLPSFESALLIADEDGGFSRFLGADPDHIEGLRKACQVTERLDSSHVMTEPVYQFSISLKTSLLGGEIQTRPTLLGDGVEVHSSDYLTDLLDWIVGEVEGLLQKGLRPSQIAIVSPFVSDALRFLLTYKLDRRAIPWVSHRPSRAIADEPFNRCLLTIAAIAHAEWKAPPSRETVAQMLMIAMDGLDLIRAGLLANTLYRIKDGAPELSSFLQLRPEMQERIGFHQGELFERLREWLERSQQHPPAHLDKFLSRLFGELLSQPGFGFHGRMDAGRAAAAMISSIQKFRAVVDPGQLSRHELGRQYYRLIEEGLLAAQYQMDEREAAGEAVQILPAFTYLTFDRKSSVQFWLDIGSPAWAERLYQPLTHPYVMSRTWDRGEKWTDEHERDVRREIAATLTTGLIRRCREKIYLCHSAYGEQGLEQQGVLLNAIQRILTQNVDPAERTDV